MTVNRRKKNSRARGTWTHGWGEKKKHRHAGSRGGRGMAGTGKRADQKKPSIDTDPKYFGKFGFTSINPTTDVTINVGLLASNIETFVAEKLATKSAKGYDVDLTKTQYTKLLGSGQVSVVLNITVAKAVSGAIEKIEAAGGKVTVTEVKVEKKAKASKAKAE